MVAWNAYRTGDLAAAQRYAAEGAAIAAGLDDPEPAADFAYLRAVFAATLGDPAATADHVAAAVEGYERTGSVALAQVWNVQAAMHLLAGDLQAAVGAYEETAGAARRAGLRQIEAIAQANLADALTTLGRYDEAAEAIEHGRRAANELGLMFVQHLLASFSAAVAFGRGDIAAMEREWERSRELAANMGTPEVRARTTETTVQLLLAKGDAAAAAETARDGLDDFGAAEKGDATALLAVALAEAGRAEDAVVAAAEALRAPRPYVVMTPRLAALVAIALGGADAVMLGTAALAAAQEMHLVLPLPLRERLGRVLARSRADLGDERTDELERAAMATALTDLLDAQQG
jgi:ATP/maltotriose-dependent transcriptional regulator MalT